MPLLNKIPDLVTLKAICNGALKGDALPSRLKLLNWGTNDTVKGPAVVDDVAMDAFSANQKALGFERVALDFEHNTVPGSPEYERTREPRDIAAQGTPVMRRGDGLWMEDLSWFNLGKEKAGTYEDLSPAIKQDESGRVVFMHSAALCRNGAVYGLTFLSSAGAGARASGLKGHARMKAVFERDNSGTFNTTLRRFSGSIDTSKLTLLKTEGLHGMDLLQAGFHNDQVRAMTASVDGDKTAEAAARESGGAGLLDSAAILQARAPKEIQVLYDGRQMSGSGFVTVGDDSAELVRANNSMLARGRCPIMLPAVVQQNGLTRQATTLAEAETAGTGIPVVRPGAGLWLEDVQWTPVGLNALLEYDGLTPSVWLDNNRQVVGLRSVMLSCGDHIVSQSWPRFLTLAADRPLKGISRLAAAFEAINKKRKP